MKAINYLGAVLLIVFASCKGDNGPRLAVAAGNTVKEDYSFIATVQEKPNSVPALDGKQSYTTVITYYKVITTSAKPGQFSLDYHPTNASADYGKDISFGFGYPSILANYPPSLDGFTNIVIKPYGKLDVTATKDPKQPTVGCPDCTAIYLSGYTVH